jgi:two-component sensor histidine kinase
MQMLQSLLFTAAKKATSDEARHVLNEASGRIAAMAAAQRVLYGTSDTTRFAANEFLQSVCETVRQTLPASVNLTCQPASGVLSTDAAMPLSLILNELITNAVKHGAKNQRSGGIRVEMIERGVEFELSVEDSGEGFELATVRKTSSGLQLVLGLARQIHGTIEVTRDPSRVTLRFPAERAS